MKIYPLTILIACLMFLLSNPTGLSAQELPPPFRILPKPQHISIMKGSGLKYDNLYNVFLKGNISRPVMGEILSRLPETDTGRKGTLVLNIDTNHSGITSDEGYILTVLPQGVEIVARGKAGLFYGCQSLEQLLEDSKEFKKPVPSCRITDNPALSYRAVQFDVKHHLDHMNYYYESIDRLARYKINAVVFEFEDKLRYERQPLVAAPQAISINEMAALTQYARKRNIEITPLVQGLGHATFILKHEQYAHLRELPYNRWAFCPLHEGTYQVLFDLYRDAIKATPGSKYLHIGGDEIGNIGLCGRCKPTADKDGMMSLNLYWLKRVCKFAEENDRIPIFWDDMPLHHAGVYESTYKQNVTEEQTKEVWEKGIPVMDSLLADFPKNCVYMRWNYSMARQIGNINALDWYNNRGLKAMIATVANSGGGMMFQSEHREKSLSSGVTIIRSFIQLAAEKNINGMLCTAWDDASPHMENFWRGYIAAAEYSWNPEGRTLDEFDKTWLHKEFGVQMPDYVQFINKLNAGSNLWYTAYMKSGRRTDGENALESTSQLEHWLPPVEGREKKQIDHSAVLIELPDPKSPGNWSRKYKERLEQSLIEMNDYRETSDRLTNLYKTSIKNRYYWALSSALYELQHSAPRILLALKQCDTSDLKLQQSGIENVRKEINLFKKTWSELESVYSETRFISNPDTYVPDRYFHYSSQREDLTWMIQPEEKFFEMIEDWLIKKMNYSILY